MLDRGNFVTGGARAAQRDIDHLGPVIDGVIDACGDIAKLAAASAGASARLIGANHHDCRTVSDADRAVIIVRSRSHLGNFGAV